MFDLYKIWKHQGQQYIPDVLSVTLPNNHAGKPLIEAKDCKNSCNICKQICPTKAIDIIPVNIDLGKCVFCGECEALCPEKKIKFTPDYKICSNDPGLLIIREGEQKEVKLNPDKIRKEIKRLFGHSLKLRLVSAGSCNGCELELSACGNVNFDMGRYGIDFFASPRHCDGVVVTGPIVSNSVEALRITIEAVPQPKLLILSGACAVSGGIFSESNAVNRSILDIYKPDLFVPGCPPHPLTFISGVLALIKGQD
jgi:Ni,Fe-hydrogenase III small subunit/NAD-dependent dihydropyrimidine dehydrogenase PreA subunit